MKIEKNMKKKIMDELREHMMGSVTREENGSKAMGVESQLTKQSETGSEGKEITERERGSEKDGNER